jgi:hypothetical protein
MVEQLTLNQRVAGSSPARFTNCFFHLQAFLSDARQAVVAETVANTRLDRERIRRESTNYSQGPR